MKNKEDNLKKNIGYLKCAYGETNLDLALAIGIKSPNTISNYIKASRYPEKEIREKIARHYRITEAELMYSDFSGLKFNWDLFGDAKKMNEISSILYPIVCTETALQDFYFKKGYNAQMRAVDAMKNGKAYSEADSDISINAYIKSYEKNESPESVVNLLWWYLLIENTINNQSLMEGVKSLNEKNIKNKDLLKIYHLEDCSEDFESNILDEIEENSMEELDEAIMELLKELKQNIEYVPLADYYIALRYITGGVNNDQTPAMNKSVGEEMMLILVRLENEYAIRYLQLGRNNLNK